MICLRDYPMAWGKHVPSTQKHIQQLQFNSQDEATTRPFVLRPLPVAKHRSQIYPDHFVDRFQKIYWKNHVPKQKHNFLLSEGGRRVYWNRKFSKSQICITTAAVKLESSLNKTFHQFLCLFSVLRNSILFYFMNVKTYFLNPLHQTTHTMPALQQWAVGYSAGGWGER